MQSQLLDAGILFLVGMSVVFVFLTMLIVCIRILSWVARIFPEAELSSQASTATPHMASGVNTSNIDPNVLTAIQTAINTHRQELK